MTKTTEPLTSLPARPRDGFLALLGNDSELDLVLLDVKNRVGDLSLRKNNLILSIFGYRLSFAHLGEKYFGIKRGFSSLPHKASLFFFHKDCSYPTKAGRGGSAIGLSATDAIRAAASDDYSVRLFKAYVC
jgi:hypothetical protein